MVHTFFGRCGKTRSRFAAQVFRSIYTSQLVEHKCNRIIINDWFSFHDLVTFPNLIRAPWSQVKGIYFFGLIQRELHTQAGAHFFGMFFLSSLYVSN